MLKCNGVSRIERVTNLSYVQNAEGRNVHYRCVAVGLEVNGHPVQCLTNSWGDANDWAVATIKKFSVPVQMFELREVLMEVRRADAAAAGA